MRILVWLARGAAFFVLFAFALNNQHEVTLHWFFGVEWRGQMVFVVLGALAAGCILGALAMLPSWWRHRRQARLHVDEPLTVSPQGAQETLPETVPAHPPRDGL
jgi:lipopolysaccharide assembly protein A